MNKMYPGRADYSGPTTGVFGLLHHHILSENSHDVRERVDYVRLRKPKNEIPTRLHNMIYLGECKAAMLYAEYNDEYKAKYAMLYDEYSAKYNSLGADYSATRELLDADYEAKGAPLYTGYKAKCDGLHADYEAKRYSLDADCRAARELVDADYKAKISLLEMEIVEYIWQHIPDCAWNGRELLMPEYPRLYLD